MIVVEDSGYQTGVEPHLFSSLGSSILPWTSHSILQGHLEAATFPAQKPSDDPSRRPSMATSAAIHTDSHPRCERVKRLYEIHPSVPRCCHAKSSHEDAKKEKRRRRKASAMEYTYGSFETSSPSLPHGQSSHQHPFTTEQS